MTLAAGIRIALGGLCAHKLRSALTLLGIMIGVAAVMATVSVGAGAEARVAEQIRSLGSNLLVVLPGASTSGGLHLGRGSRLTLREDDADAIATEISVVDLATPSVLGSAQVVYGNTNWSTGIEGVRPDFLALRDWDVASGQMFAARDVGSAAKVAVLGQTVWAHLFGDLDPVGQTIRIKNVPFTVVGLLTPKGQTAFGHDQDDVILIPLTTAKRKLLGMTQSHPRAVRSINVRVQDASLMSEAETRIRLLLRQRHRIRPGEDDDFEIRNLAEIAARQKESARVMAVLLAAIASISLLVGGIGIMNIMLVSVTERTREIGLRMAVGARPRDIRRQFLVEAVTLSVAGGLVGILAGLLVSAVIASLARWPIQVPLESVALAFAFSGLVGVFFGFYPARRAASLDPIEALRNE